MSSGCEQRFNLLCIVFPLCGSSVSTLAKYSGGGLFTSAQNLYSEHKQITKKKKNPGVWGWAMPALVDILPMT